MVPSQPAKLSATPRKNSDVRSNEERMADARSGEMEKAPSITGCWKHYEAFSLSDLRMICVRMESTPRARAL